MASARQSASIPTATEVGSGVHADKRNQSKSISLKFWRWVLRLSRDSTLRIVWRELCNLPHRIRWVAQINEAEHLRGSATIHRWLNEASIPPPESRQSACIRYIRRTRERHPFLSIFDIHLITKSWIAGSEWSAHNTDTSRNPENPENSTLQP